MFHPLSWLKPEHANVYEFTSFTVWLLGLVSLTLCVLVCGTLEWPLIILVKAITALTIWALGGFFCTIVTTDWVQRRAMRNSYRHPVFI